MATLHLASENLDPDLVGQMFSFPLGVVQIHHKTHMWFASTDPLSGLTPEARLAALTNAVAKRLDSIKTLYPDVELTFSVLVTIPGFDVKDFPRDLITETTKMGELVIEFPSRARRSAWVATRANQSQPDRPTFGKYAAEAPSPVSEASPVRRDPLGGG